MTNAKTAASNKQKADADTIKQLRKELEEKSKDVVKYRTGWKRAKFDA